MFKKNVFACSLLCVVVLAFSGCDYFRPKHEQEGIDDKSKDRTTQKKDITPTETPVVVPDSVRISTVPDPLADCITKEVNAYRIVRDSELFPGALANSSIGDLAIQNDQIRFAITTPPSQEINVDNANSGNKLIDIVHLKSVPSPDYIESYSMVPDLESTETLFVWKDYVVNNNPKFASSIVMKGNLGRYLGGDEYTSLTLKVEDGVNVVTSWSLHACSNVVMLTTKITNNTSDPVSLLPGDVFRPGELTTFVNDCGFINSGIFTKTDWALATLDDFSLGLVNYTQKKLEGIFSSKVWFVRQYGEGDFQSPYADFTKSSTETLSKKSESTPHVNKTSEGTGVAPANRLHENELKGIIESIKSRTSTPPSTESNYETKGGGNSISESDPNSTQSRLMLAPGESYTYSRGLIVSDSDMKRIPHELIRTGITTKTGIVAGAVVEMDTNLAVGNSDVLISGGPGWDGKGAPVPYLQIKTKEDGTFAVRLPAGRYEILPAKPGRIAVNVPPVLKLTDSTDPKMFSLTLSKESIVSVAVADGDKPVKTGIPSKLTILTKSSFRPFEFPYTGNIEQGVRNVIYMPDGAARFALTPGSYQIIASHGIEYGIETKDVVIEPQKPTKLLYRLKREVPIEGMLSVDTVMTSASSRSLLSKANAVVMAACEGVHGIISGDYGVATDLQPYIDAYDFRSRLKSYSGMRFLVGGYNEIKADVWVYPVSSYQREKELKEFYLANAQIAPDLFLQKLKSTYPELYVQIEDVLEARRGYLSSADFDDVHLTYNDSSVPPPDFDGIQIMEKSSQAYYFAMKDRYFDLQRRRLEMSNAQSISALAFSSTKLPFGNEIGFPRVYIRTPDTSIDSLTEKGIYDALKRQRYLVTNGPIISVKALSPQTNQYDRLPGDIDDLSTTNSMSLKLQIMSASWIDVSDFNVYYDGRMVRSIQLSPRETIIKFPDPRVTKKEDSGRITYSWNEPERKDTFVEVMAFSERKALYPIVSTRPEFGNTGVFPIAWTSPLFLDEDGDGKIGDKSMSLVVSPSEDVATTETETVQ